MTARRSFLVALAIMLAVTTACHKEPPPPPAPTGPSAAELERARQDSIARARQAADAATAAAAAREREARAAADRAAAAQRELRATLERVVNFDYDESDITPAAEAILREKADILRANADVRLRLVGHADERGSTEYNLALGARRADEVKKFFTSFGLDAARFETQSRGEEQPLVARSDEEAWAQNRRAEFAITAGGAELRSPR